MKTIVVASENPVKLQAARHGFRSMFPGEEFAVQSVNVPSGVRPQPLSDAETLLGAQQRACAARQAQPGADYWIGIEGGLEDVNGELSAFAWVCILSNSLAGKGRTGAFFLPQQVAELVRQGKELGEADDIVFGLSNSKQKNGAVGILTDNAIDRAGYYTQAVILALIPFKNPAYYLLQAQ